MNVTVYTMPNCVQCDQTKRYLDRGDVKYDVIDISTDTEAYEKVTALGYKAAPIVIANDEHWSGFRLEKLKGLIDRVHLESVHSVA